ncbi:MAG: M15 family metallopeptidase [Planctomycetota bacterium]
MGILTEQQRAWWIAMEDAIVDDLVDLGERGFAVDHVCCRRGWTDDPRVLVRSGVADALERAREALPVGHTFKVCDGWRPWALQQRCAERAEAAIRQGHSDWTDEQVDAHVQRMAPRLRVVPRLDSHRYGGAVDLTLLGPDADELNMGVPVSHNTDSRADLLHYHLRDDLTAEQRTYRDNRTLLIRAMSIGGFDPYLAEFWHWGYKKDL